jgi:tetratricopeptide (TPR) repeat protein
MEDCLTGHEDAFATAKRYHRAGDLRRAEEGYRRVLEDAPQDAPVHYYLGALCLAQGRYDEAATCLREATRRAPEHGSAHDLLGIALAKQGDGAGAEACFRRALALQPHHAGAHHNLGRALDERGALDEAEASYRAAIRLQSDHYEAQLGLASLLTRRERFPEALDHFRRAVALQPHSPEAHKHLADALFAQRHHGDAEPHYRAVIRLRPGQADAHLNLGIGLLHRGSYEEAVASLRAAVRCKPDSPIGYNNLGAALLKLRRHAEARANFEQALRLQPDLAEAHQNLVSLLVDEGDLDGAKKWLLRALELAPDSADAHYNRGVLLLRSGRPEESCAAFGRALELDPAHIEAHKCLGMARLALGDFAGGWPEYDWRLKLDRFAALRLRLPLWDGAPLAGKTILLIAEQGMGDTLQYVRYTPLLRARGGRVVVACQPPLLGILTNFPGVDRLVPQGGPPVPDVDVYAPLMSVPGLFGTTLDTIPADIPYLAADPALVAQWRARLRPADGLRVGIVWQGNREQIEDRYRSFPLACFAPLARVPGVRLFSLQKGFGAEQLDAPGVGFPVTDLGRPLDERTGAFVETAAVLKNLDLLVTADTALAHLAGALGVPVWVALSHAADCRWLRAREDTPWYPTMRLFRQTAPGAWAGVFERIAVALHQRIDATQPIGGTRALPAIARGPRGSGPDDPGT